MIGVLIGVDYDKDDDDDDDDNSNFVKIGNHAKNWDMIPKVVMIVKWYEYHVNIHEHKHTLV